MLRALRPLLARCAVPASAFALGATAHASVQPQTAAAKQVAPGPAVAFSLKDRSGRTYVDGTGSSIGGGRFRLVARLQRLIPDGRYVLRIGLPHAAGPGAASLVYDLTAKSR
jgi:hypothetical protein